MVFSSVAIATARKGISSGSGSFILGATPCRNPEVGKAESSSKMHRRDNPNFGRERASRYSDKMELSQAGIKCPATACWRSTSQTRPGDNAADTSTFVSMTQSGTLILPCAFCPPCARLGFRHRFPPWSDHPFLGELIRAGSQPGPGQAASGQADRYLPRFRHHLAE
jgi:hypothetical protein